MLKKFVRTIVPALAAIVLLAGAVHAQSPDPNAPDANAPHHHWHHHPMMDADGVPIRLMLKAANLTDAQKSQIKQIFESRHATMKPQLDQLKTAHEQIMSKLLTPGTVTTADLSASMQQISQLRGQLAQARLEDAVAIRNLLTPDQLAAVAQAKADFQKKMAVGKGECKLKHDDAGPPEEPLE